MLRITDRYLLREIIPPFLLALLVCTFLLMLPPIMEVAEDLIAKGVDGVTILRLMATLLPQGLGLTIPIALLLGILMGCGRLSSDRECVVLQACGMSLYRMLYPIALLAVATCAVTGYILIVALPDANQAFREITFRTIADRAEGEVRPRVFDEYFSRVVLYVREVSTRGDGWSEVFLADLRESDQPDVYVAERGRILLDRETRRVDIVLTGGAGHIVDPSAPETYEVHDFDEMVIQIDAESVFPRRGPQRGLREYTIEQLHAEADRLTSAGLSPHRPIMEIHRKFAIPVACLVFALVGLALGVTSRKDGKLASFALGIGVVFAYYVLMYGAEAMAKGALVSPHLAMWIPNIILGASGLALLVWRSRSVERRIMIPWITRGTAPLPADFDPDDDQRGPDRSHLLVATVRTPRAGHLLDWYVARIYLATTLLAGVGLIGIFYISTFVDLSDKLFKGETTGWRLLEYFWYATPQFVYYVLPIAALVACLVTIGLLTKSSELTVMKACGISLYRAALPIFLFSLAWGGAIFAMSETFLAHANRRAETINREIRSGVQRPAEVLHRNWMLGDGGSIYHFLSFDPELDEIGHLSVYDFSGRPWQLARRTYAMHAAFMAEDGEWEGHDTWVRDLSAATDDRGLFRADVQRLPFLEPPDYFEAAPPDADLMNVRDLGTYVNTLRGSGFDVVQLVVAMHRKMSFPFVTVVLTLIAVPFAVTLGPRGALYGVGAGIAIACTYWVVLSVFGAIGSAGLLTPILAAWAPNVLFGASAAYLLLTVRT